MSPRQSAVDPRLAYPRTFVMPSPPTSSLHNKNVHFAPLPAKDPSRSAFTWELISLGNLEKHASQCPQCNRPYDGYDDRRYMCTLGRGLVFDSDLHVKYKDGDIYTRKKSEHGTVRLQLNGSYPNAVQALRLLRKKGPAAFALPERKHESKHKHGHRHHKHGSRDSSHRSSPPAPAYLYDAQAPLRMPDPQQYVDAQFRTMTYDPAPPRQSRDDGRHSRSPEKSRHHSRRSASTAATIGDRTYSNTSTFRPGRD